MSESTTPQDGGRSGQITTAAMIIYGTLSIMIFAIPQSISNWLKDRDTMIVRALLLPLANTIETASNLAGVTYPYLYLRKKYLSATGNDEPD
jgi:hypothetical protein